MSEEAGPAAAEECARECVRAREHVWVKGQVRGNKIMLLKIRFRQRVRRLQTGVE